MDAMLARSTVSQVQLGEFVPEADKRIYRRLGIQEAWFWRRDQLVVFELDGDAYVERPTSSVVPGADLALLARLSAVLPVSAAIAELHEILRTAR